jgi:hypothetical protein
MNKHNVISGAKFMKSITPALGLESDAPLRRIVLDIPHDGPVFVYVEYLGDERLVQVDWAGAIKDTEIKVIK